MSKVVIIVPENPDGRVHDFLSSGRVDVHNVVVRDGLSVLVPVPDHVMVQVLEVPTEKRVSLH